MGGLVSKVSYSCLSLMVIALRTQFHVERPWGNACLAYCLNSVLNVKVVVAAFNHKKALGAFSVIVQLHRYIGLLH